MLYIRTFLGSCYSWHALVGWRLWLWGLMIKYYRLNDNNEVEECDMFQAEEFLRSPRKIIKQENVDNHWVSTVMLSIDHNFVNDNGSDPILFETMTKTDGEWDGYEARYRTYQEALAGHNTIVSKLKKGLPLNDIED